MQSTFQLLYKTVSSRRKKERFETILEPLQAILQIALLSFHPVGTKLTIQHNILMLQPPAYSQSVARWYNNDTKEDLYFLFNVFHRFKKFYAHYKSDASGSSVQHRLYALLIDLSKTGINKLIRTYGQTDKPHILQTLTMYKFILDDQLSPELMTLPPPAANPTSSSKPYKMKPIANDDDDSSSVGGKEMSSSNNTVDDIFITIVDIYTPELLNIIYNALILTRDNESNYQAYADGLNKILEPTCIQLKKWIDEHIVY